MARHERAKPVGVDGRRVRRLWARRIVLAFVAVPLGLLVGSVAGVFGQSYDWRTAPRHSIGIAPDPATTPEAVVQVYVARAFAWRSAFGVHSWIAVKPSGASRFTVYEVIGWHVMHGGSALSRSHRPPDGLWYGNRPEIIAEARGDGVDALIERIEAAAEAYPFPDDYTVWPGPNSNTFTAYIARIAPELRVDLPPTAIGKDYLTDGVIARAPSGTGWQASLFGLVGVLLAAEEGFEINLLGLTFGFDWKDPALKLPGIGRIDLFGKRDPA